jgi:hypothetical protein
MHARETGALFEPQYFAQRRARNRAVEAGANACPSGVAENCENACTGAALEGGYTSGSAADRHARVKERAAEPGAAAEGDARVGEQARRCECARCWVQGIPGRSALNENSTCAIIGVRATHQRSDRSLPRTSFRFGAFFLTGKTPFSGKAW